MIFFTLTELDPFTLEDPKNGPKYKEPLNGLKNKEPLSFSHSRKGVIRIKPTTGI